MKNYPRILTIQDISCVGQCSLTVALPILSACGAETCILPSAVLSTHTGGFSGFTVRDLTDDIPAIAAHWQKEGILFDGIYTGYLGSIPEIGYVQDIFRTLRREGAKTFVDPAMADNGRLYGAFDMAYADAMKPLCFGADVVLPNLTEACLLTDTPYRETYDEAYITELVGKLQAAGAGTIVLTGISYSPDRTGVVVAGDGRTQYYSHHRIDRTCHGTGDVFASVYIGAALQGVPAFEAAKLAADFTVSSIEATVAYPEHWYGMRFETQLPALIQALQTL